jgi:exopolysaccharide production protein ExoZ
LIALGRGKDAGAILLAVVALPLLGYALDGERVLWRMVTNPILWEFGFGIIAFKLWDTRLLARLRRPLLGVAVLAAVAIVVVGASRGLPIFGASRTVVGEGSAARVLIWGLPAFGLVCLMLSMDKLSDGPVAGMLKSVGDASYSIYLSHLFVVMAIEKLLRIGPLPPDVALLATFTCSAVVGVIVYRLIENPMLATGRKWLRCVSRRLVAAQGRSV